MIFWIFAILTIVGIAIVAAIGKISNEHSYKEEENTKFVNFVCRNDEPLATTSGVIAIISGIIVFFMLAAIIINQVNADGERAKYEQTYTALIYKSQTESVRDEFGIINKEYIDEVQAWNESLARCQSYSRNFWIGIFYPKRKFDGLEFIDLESIKMKE